MSSIRIPPPCDHDPIRLSNAMTVFGSPGTLPAEFKCARCGVRWFVDEAPPLIETPWAWSTKDTDAIGTQMGIPIPGEDT